MYTAAFNPTPISSMLADKYPFVSAKEWTVLEDICKSRTLKRGEIFLVQGMTPKQCAFVKTGAVKYSFVSSDGRESILTFGFESDYISDCESYQNDLAGTFSVTATTATELLVIENRQLDSVCEQYPGLMKLCLKFSRNIVFQQYKRSRLLTSNSPFIRYSMALDLFPNLERNISQTNFAKYINVSRETLSRVRRARLKTSI